MSERPILFSTEMVRAILAGRKAQTRRVVKLTPELLRLYGDLSKAFPDPGFGGFGYLHVPCPEVRENGVLIHDATVQRLYCPYVEYELENHLWVRESAWRFAAKKGKEYLWRYDADICDDERKIAYEDYKQRGWKRIPSIFMPHRVSRITLDVTGVRAERLQAITPEDIKAEGFGLPPEDVMPANREFWLRDLFARGWDKINGKRKNCSWQDNPWVWVIQFSPYNPSQEEE